jgi:hypothetical protein
MHVGGVVHLYAYNVLWRATGLLSAGRKLLEFFDSGDEDLRSLAGMLLVRAGKKAEPLIDDALEKREHLPYILTILGDIGDLKYEPKLRQFANDPDGDIATAARDALRVLNTQWNRQQGS